MAADPAIALLPRAFGRLRAQFAGPSDFEPELPRADGTDRRAGVPDEVAQRLGENYPLLGSNPAESPERARKLFAAANMHNVRLALVQLPQSWFGETGNGVAGGGGYVTGLRSVLMKPEHETVAACNLGEVGLLV